MSTLAFVTGNAGKFRELSAVIPELIQLDVDVAEIQELDPQAVLRHKLNTASAHHDGPIIAEDTSLTFACLGGRLPGPFIKWFLGELKPEGLFELVSKYDDYTATARATLGYRDEHGIDHFFTGEVRGTIVAPRGTAGFGWDQIFQPDGYQQTFAEMGSTKNTMSHRYLASQQLAAHLTKA